MRSTHNLAMNPIAKCIRKVCLPAASLFLALNPGFAFAGPEGGQVAGGQGNISTPNSTTTVINQQSQNLAIDWNSFDVNANELVQFNQPSKTATALNRIHSQNASQIFGTINANGNVLLVNPNGVFFKPGSSVNVNSLTASGLDLSTSDFMNGKYNFNGIEGKDGIVVNQGVLQAATGGSISLIGKAVKNEGVILASAGQVNMVAGQQITLDFDGDGLMQFAVDKEVVANAQSLDAAVSNTGEINADGGSVLLKGAAAKDVFSKVVNNEGVIKAGRIENKGGEIRLVGMGAGSSVLNTGTINADAGDAASSGGTIELIAANVTNTGTISANAQGGDGGFIKLQSKDITFVSGDSVITATSSENKGGTVHVLGNTVALLDNTYIDVSGELGGGEVLVGGENRGKDPDIQYSKSTTVTENIVIKADAITDGDGGKVIVWSDVWGHGTTKFTGHISARGGALSGDGGFAEVSGYYLNFEDGAGSYDLRAPFGQTGMLLFDPNTGELHNGIDVCTATACFLDAPFLALLVADTADITIDLTGSDTSSQDDDFTITSNVSMVWGGAGNNRQFIINAADEVIDLGGTFTTGGGAGTQFNDGDVDLIFDADINQTKVFNGAGADPSLTSTDSGALANGGDLLTGGIGRAAGDKVGSYAYTAGNLLMDSSGGSNRIYEFHITSADNFEITKKTITVTSAAVDVTKVFDGTDAALNALISGTTDLTGLVAGFTTVTADISGAVYDTGVDVITGDTTTVSYDGNLSGGDAGNYQLAGASTQAGNTADIMQAPSALYIGLPGSNWNTAANWNIGGFNAVPTKDNVFNVDLAGIAEIIYNVPSGTNLNSISNANTLSLQGGAGLLNLVAGLNIQGLRSTGGSLTTGGTLTVLNDFSQTGAGIITVAGDIDITNSAGTMGLGSFSTTNDLTIVSAGAISSTANVIAPGDIDITGTISSTGGISGNSINITGNGTFGGTMVSTSSATIGGSLNTGANAITTGTFLSVGNNLVSGAINAGTTVTVGGTSNITGGVTSTGNGNLTFSGASTMSNGNVTGGTITFGNTLNIGTTAMVIKTSTGTVNFTGAVSGAAGSVLAVDVPDGTVMTVAAGTGANQINSNAFGGLNGHLILGGTITPLTSPTKDATSLDISAQTITVNNALTSGGAITFLAGDIELNADITAGAPGATGGALSFIAPGTDLTVGSTSGTGKILIPNLITVEGSEAIFIAGDSLDDSSNIVLDLIGGLVEVATGSATAAITEFAPGSDATTGPTTGSTEFITFLGLFSVPLNVTQVAVLNPAADLIGLEELGFIDTGLFEQDLTLFGQIGTGIALALAQCEEIEGCAPNVTEEELDEFIAQIEARLEELIRRASEARNAAEKEKIEKLIAGYQEELNNFIQYRIDLQAYLTVDEEEEFEEDFGEDDFGGAPDAEAIRKLGKMLETVNARIQWLESLKVDLVERERVSKLTGIELTQESLDAIIDGAKSEAKFIEKQIELLRGPQANFKSDPLFIAEAGDYSLTQVVNYGPSLLNIGNENTSHAWY
jgi:filamentous hemagglutinin family protein